MHWRLQWNRRGETALRRLASADVGALRALRETDQWRSVAGDVTSRREDPPEHSTAHTFVTDHQVAGAVRFQMGRLQIELGPQAWSQLSEAADLLEPKSAPCETLLVDAIGWRKRIEENDAIDAFVGSDLPALCRQLGARRTVVPVPLSSDSSPDDAELPPPALLQQIHHGAAAPPRLAPFLRADFELRGYRPSTGAGAAELQAFVVWRHPRL